jgi:hypothetical protein
MEKHLSLIKNDLARTEKRRLPRFPFCYLTFKPEHNSRNVFEVMDISYSGMKIALKLGEHGLSCGESLSGNIHWSKSQAKIEATVVWVDKNLVGVEFTQNPVVKNSLNQMLSVKNIVAHLKPLHQNNLGMNLPVNLKIWLRADGPIELFVWQHKNGEISRFQFIMLTSVIEWSDGEGLSSGVVKAKKSFETPLLSEDEFIFDMDKVLDLDKVAFASALTREIDSDLLSSDVKAFIGLKL